MDDATRRSDGAPEEQSATDALLTELVGRLTHLVLGFVEAEAFPLADRLARESRDPFSAIELIAVTLHALADGLEAPSRDWLPDA